MTINHDTVLTKVAKYLSEDEGVFHRVRDLATDVPFDEEDNATVRGVYFTLGNIVVGSSEDEPHYKGLTNLYKLILYTSDSCSKSYVAFERNSKQKKRDFIGMLGGRKGDIYEKMKVKIKEDGETKEMDISVFKRDVQ